jgi:hypothetical protein
MYYFWPLRFTVYRERISPMDNEENTPKTRPPKRTHRLSIPLDKDTYDKAVYMARGSPNLVTMIRAWLKKFGNEEAGPIATDEEMKVESTRAQKVSRKKKR